MRRSGAVLALVALLVGTPLLLVRLGYYAWGQLNLWAPADFRLLLAALTVIAWLAWAAFVLSAAVEGVRIATSGRIAIRLPGLSVAQGLAGVLLAAVVATAATSTAAAPTSGGRAVAAALADAPSGASTASDAEARGVQASPMATAAEATAVHVVAEGDDLWTLAVRYYNDGSAWRKIVAANPDLLAADPTADLPPGSALAIVDPIATVDAHVALAKVKQSDPASPQEYRVEKGDTLWDLAEDRLGDGARYPELVRLNAATIDDPDHIETGWTIRLPARRPAATSPHAPAPAKASPEATPNAATPTPSQSPPTSPAPVTSAPAALAPATPAPGGGDAAGVDEPAPIDPVALRVVLGGLTALAAGGVLAVVRLRRRDREWERELGRTFPRPNAELLRIETALGVADAATRGVSADGRPEALATPHLALVARGMRLLSAAWMEAGEPTPRLRRAILDTDGWLLQFGATPATIPAPFVADEEGAARVRWDDLEASPERDGAVAYPGLVTLGEDALGRLVMADALAWGVLAVDGDRPGVASMSLSALTLELGCSPWSDEVDLRVVTREPGFVAAAASGPVSVFADAEAAVADMERLVRERRALLTVADESYAKVVRDPDRADAWRPVVYVFESEPDADSLARVRSALADEPPGVAALLPAAGDAADAPRLVLRAQGAGDPSGTLLPEGLAVSAQTLRPEARDALVGLLSAARSAETLPASWWREDAPLLEPVPDVPSAETPDDPDESLATHGPGLTAQTLPSDWASLVGAELSAGAWPGPRLRLFGEVSLAGAAGTPPPKARRRCLEYLGWLLENPGATASEMTAAMFVTDGTRRANLSRLRAWLGRDPAGGPYLPDAYSGRIVVRGVDSDWAEFCRIIDRGVNRLAPEALREALELVAGAPLADAAPGEWAWADDLRRRMCEAIRDASVVLARRELGRGDVDAARWACRRGLLVAADDELLAVELMRVEAADGDPDAAASVLRGLRAAAERDGVDLRPETVRLAQELLEGRRRGDTVAG